MDTSKTFIKQCEKAKEIQKLRRNKKDWEQGDWHSVHGWCTGWVGDWEDRDKRLPECIWLPRQDQLQEMVNIVPKTATLQILADVVGGLIDVHVKIYGYSSWTWEKFWLAFVMKEKFNKKWDGTDWVKDLLKRL